MPFSVLLVGRDSLIGTALEQRLRDRGCTIFGTSRRDVHPGGGQTYKLDLAAPPSEWVLPDRVDYAVICAGMTNQRLCVENPALARLVNVDHTIAFCRRFLAQGARILFPSTNLVFACDRALQPADSPYAPLTAYAAQKMEVEQFLVGYSDKVSICRLGKVISCTMPLIAGWIGDLRLGKEVQALHDLRMSPVSLAYTVTFLDKILQSSQGGIFQIGGEKEISYCDLARRLAEHFGGDESLAHCHSSYEIGQSLATMPRHPSLDTSRTQRELGIPPQSLDALMTDLVQEFQATAA
jgi:dTDP-4-dehydrorhamnose reductase